jgi:hypothetical protein
MADVLGGDRQYQWVDLDVPRDCWWEIADNPQASLDGWVYFDLHPSVASDDHVVLTFYRVPSAA